MTADSECDVCAGRIDENALREPSELIESLRPGDIFHARSSRGASLICLVTDIDGRSVHARRVTTQEEVAFDRQTGRELFGEREGTCRIDSVEPLPTEIHNVFVVMDRRYRLGRDFTRIRLTEAEKGAILFAADHYDEYRFELVRPTEEKAQ
jgi:hypothetical protein